MKKTDLKKILEGFENVDFINLIYEIIKNDEKANQKLLDFCEKRSKTPKRNIKIENSIKRCWTYAKEVLQTDINDVCDEEDEILFVHLLYDIEKLSETNYISWNLKKSILDESIQYIKKKETSFVEILIEFCKNLCNTNEEKSYLYANLPNLK